MGKRMTAKEKKFRAEVRAELREKGLIPPVKAPLNRRKFSHEVWKEYEAVKDKFILHNVYIPEALMYITSGTDITKVTPEMVGALKVIKLALDIQKFKTELNESKHPATIGEYFEQVVIPIINL